MHTYNKIGAPLPKYFIIGATKYEVLDLYLREIFFFFFSVINFIHWSFC